MRTRSSDHIEAVRLAWKSQHIPIFTILLVSWALAGVLSSLVSIFLMGPSNPIP
jgi:hypothetical protein